MRLGIQRLIHFNSSSFTPSFGGPTLLMSTNLMKRIALGSLLLTLLLLAIPSAVHAQAVSIASMTGRVVDSSGAVVVGAQIKMTAVDTRTVHSAPTTAEGLSNIPSLPIGAY